MIYRRKWLILTSFISLMVFVSFMQINYVGNYKTVKINGEYLIKDSSNYQNITIDNFDEFILGSNSSYVTSEKSQNCISFNKHAYNPHSSSIENYILNLDEYGNCTNFELKARFNYTLSRTNEDMSFKIKLGSCFDSNGFCEDLTSRPDDQINICSMGIENPNDNNFGYHVIYVYPNEKEEKYNGAYGFTLNEGDIEVYAVRKKNVLTCTLRNLVTNNVILNKTNYIGVDKPLNFINLDFCCESSSLKMRIDVYYVNAYFSFLEIPQTTNQRTVKLDGLSHYGSILVLLIIQIIVISRRSKEKVFKNY